MRHLTRTDQIIALIDRLLSSRKTHASEEDFSNIKSMPRENPASRYPEAPLSPKQIKQTIALMRINHAGEVAAQGLYQGQALTAALSDTRLHMQQAAAEETEHLTWCQDRLNELGGRASYLDPFWYWGSLMIGSVAGLAGDRWSLGFIAETEHQVATHLTHHLAKIAPHDQKTREILTQMKIDEQHHATQANTAGGKPLPKFIRRLMQGAAKIMVTTAYYV